MPSRRETGYGWNGSWQHALRKNGKFWPDERALKHARLVSIR
jgi:hypothetical protein